MRRSYRLCVPALAAVIFFIFANPAFAQSAPINLGSTITAALAVFKSAMSGWTNALNGISRSLFALLALVELLWVGFQLVLKQADISEIIAGLITLTLFLGFFNFFVNNGPMLISYIYSYFNSAASAVVTASGTPQNFATLGLLIMSYAIDQFSLWPDKIGIAIALLIAGIAIVICLVLIAAMLIETTIESYFVQYAGIVFFGFGGTRWTKDYAIKILSYAVSVGAKLFALQALAALTYQVMKTLSTPAPTDLMAFLTIMAVAIMMLALTRTIPAMIQGLITGSAINASGGFLGAAKDIAMAAAGVAAATIAASYAASAETIKAVKASQSPAEKLSQASAGLMSMPARAGGELAKAALQDLGGKLSGSFDTRHGTAGARIAHTILNGMGQTKAPPTPGATPGASPAAPSTVTTTSPTES
ncbi:MAG: P-type conjugative transfer protein TrbL [Magnetospirillum sp.]|nr:P-type conjugative transfer protein TrbL [Magnetospirillum sp.]